MIQYKQPDHEPDPELDDVARLLDEAAAQEASEMQAALELKEAPGLQKVEPTLTAAWSASARASRKRNWFRFMIAVGAAAAIIAYFLMRGVGEPQSGGPSGQFLGDDEFKVVYPPEHASRWDRVEWTGPKEGTYRLRILDTRTRAVIYGPIDNIKGTQRLLTPEDTTQWPSKITIEVEKRLKDGTWIAAKQGDSELGP